jgi:hypothetical protein
MCAVYSMPVSMPIRTGIGILRPQRRSRMSLPKTARGLLDARADIGDRTERL